jgi:hypothetical protein
LQRYGAPGNLASFKSGLQRVTVFRYCAIDPVRYPTAPRRRKLGNYPKAGIGLDGGGEGFKERTDMVPQARGECKLDALTQMTA